MSYKNELAFVEKLLKKFRIHLRYITHDSFDDFSEPKNMGLKDILNYNYDKESLLKLLDTQCNSNTIYRMKNMLMCHYFLFRLPDTEKPVYVYIGPYTLAPITKQEIMKVAEQYNVSPGNLIQLEQFYMDLPLMPDENYLLSILYTLGEYIWNDTDNFYVVDDFQLTTHSPKDVVPIPAIQESEDALLSIQILEQRYEVEQQLIQAVSNGRLHKAEMALANLSSRQMEPRADNPIRDYKNYGIILNTILRKAAESASVHPVQIDSLSSQYAKKIELITSQTSFMSLVREMVRKYCMMVKNHSLKGYSMLIRKVITDINYDLTADLGLKTLASHLNVNPSYLSTLFKKETGSTLTEYVNRKRIEHAILLLNSTDMQIQTIALYCGIPDVNYFTKTFKKIVGKTPKEYREMVTSHK